MQVSLYLSITLSSSSASSYSSSTAILFPVSRVPSECFGLPVPVDGGGGMISPEERLSGESMFCLRRGRSCVAPIMWRSQKGSWLGGGGGGDRPAVGILLCGGQLCAGYWVLFGPAGVESALAKHYSEQ